MIIIWDEEGIFSFAIFNYKISAGQKIASKQKGRYNEGGHRWGACSYN